MDSQIFQGDCREVMRGLADCSIDACVTDPPYELGFMGKGWDKSGIAYDVSVWREVLRVLKPGGHLLAFGGSRTYHRLACAIEDAGFEVRDQIQWVYASGFPKSLNVSDNLREQGSVCTCNDGNDGTQTKAEIAPTVPSVWTGVDTKNAGTNGAQGRLHHGAPPDSCSDVRLPSNSNGSSQSQEPQADCQRLIESGTLAHERRSQTRGSWPLCSGCGKPMVPEGIGSALKPAHEPIVVARKPFTTTLVQNVLKHGTGGLNIDGCRIGYVNQEDKAAAAAAAAAQRACQQEGNQPFSGGYSDGPGSIPGFLAKQDLGRWPANVIHDGSEELLAEFAKYGERTSGSLTGQPRTENRIYGSAAATLGVPRFYEGDSGSAARFFYCAKASQDDRDEGLEELAYHSAGEVTDRKDGSAGLSSPRAGAGRTNGRRNHHPTVKPVSLMRYLCRLVTPPKGMVLDPFCGSGSTGKGACLEQLTFIGIDLSPEYCEIAERRIAITMRQPNLFG